MSTPPKAVHIQPKPANEKSNAGATGQSGPTRKPWAGPLVFVNSSDLNTEGEKRGNRKMVKKWAMLNRNARHLRPQSSSGKSQFLSWDLKASERHESSSTDSDETWEAKMSREASFAPPRHPFKRPISAAPARVRLMGESVTNQFNNLSIEADPHAKTLLEWFLKGGRGDIESPGGRLATCNRLAFPMIMQSQAALCSLIAALEVNPYSPIRSNSKPYRDHWLSLALTKTNTLLQSSTPTKEVFMCVSLLVWIAHHMGEEQAARVHMSGYAALMVKHWDLFSSTPYLRNGPFFWTFPSNEGNILPETRTPPVNRLPTADMERKIERTSLVHLQLSGHISSQLMHFIPHLLAMQAIVPHAAGQLTMHQAKDLLTYILYNARTLVSLEECAHSRLEHCIRQTLLILYYASVWRDPSNGVGWMVGSMQSNLAPSDVAWLVEDRPEILLWIGLSAGHFARDLARDWWLDFLISVRHVMDLSSFTEARSVMEESMLWTRSLDRPAKQFWDDSSKIMDDLKLPWERDG